MQTLVLGATGHFGSITAGILTSDPMFNQVYVASRSFESASALAKKLGPKSIPIALDIFDRSALENAISRVEVVTNISSDPVRTAIPVMLECAKQGKHYCDVSAEADVLIEAENCAEAFRSSESSILLGCGFHPGVSDLLGVVAANELDEVNLVDMYILSTLRDFGPAQRIFDLVANDWNGGGGMNTIIYANGVDVPFVENGSKKSISPAGNQSELDNPEGVAVKMNQWSTLEALSLCLALPSVPTSRVHWGVWPPTAQQHMIDGAPRVQRGELRAGELIRSIYEESNTDTRPIPRIHYWASAKGVKGGKACSVTAFSDQDWASNRQIGMTTAKVAAFAAHSFGAGKDLSSGLRTFAQAFRPTEVFEMLAGSDETGLKTIVDFH